MPEVIWLSGGIVVPTGVVGTGEAVPVVVVVVAEPEPEPEVVVVGDPEDDEGDDADVAGEEVVACLFARRTWRSLASTAARRAKRATRALRCMATKERKRTTKVRDTVSESVPFQITKQAIIIEMATDALAVSGMPSSLGGRPVPK